jgi:hypothetical protein
MHKKDLRFNKKELYKREQKSLGKWHKFFNSIKNSFRK